MQLIKKFIIHYTTSKMPQINLTIEEHQHLTKLVARSYDNNYRSDQFDTDTYDSMADKVFDAVNNLTLEDFWNDLWENDN